MSARHNDNSSSLHSRTIIDHYISHLFSYQRKRVSHNLIWYYFNVFTARRYGRAAYAVVVCPPVRLSVCLP